MTRRKGPAGEAARARDGRDGPADVTESHVRYAGGQAFGCVCGGNALTGC